ncbi:hypothetical protein [Mucilaginibacter flavus]|uniref:hypothetical protein n=1 Tax=Mucilaginibacter flavus TaxID=931504 RepID=UPI0025B3972B|nr:hypothetical protein [Mucilaginibacter flavus]MDN3581402.1 hypothetical protein [Mucilaginibacter flavus]
MSDKNELDWKEYEAITQYIYEVLGAQDGVKVKGYARPLVSSQNFFIIHFF